MANIGDLPVVVENWCKEVDRSVGLLFAAGPADQVTVQHADMQRHGMGVQFDDNVTVGILCRLLNPAAFLCLGAFCF